MTRSEVVRLLNALGPGLTFVGVVITLGSLRSMRLAFERWGRLVLCLVGKPQSVTVRAETATLTAKASVVVHDALWNETWSVDRKIEELASRIEKLRSELRQHDHPDIRKRLDALADKDDRLSRMVEEELAGLQREEQASDRWAICGLVIAGIGAMVSVVGGFLAW